MRACGQAGDIVPVAYFPALLADGEIEQVVGILIWGIVLLVVFLAAGFVVLWIRRRLRPDAGKPSAPLSFEALEAMRASGELSEEEFRRLRRSLLSLDGKISGERPKKDANCTLSAPSNGDDEDN